MNTIVSRLSHVEGDEGNDWPVFFEVQSEMVGDVRSSVRLDPSAAFIEEQHISAGIEGALDHYKVVWLRDEPWKWTKVPAQQALPGVTYPPPNVAGIATPASFLRNLRARIAISDRPRMYAGRISLPAVLRHVGAEVSSSRTLLDLEDDWDGEGSSGYAESTWLRAVQFLSKNADTLWQELGEIIPAPTISPGPHGSFDLHWRTGKRELLINIPAEPGRPSKFYGDDGQQGLPLEGELDPNRPNAWLLMWLMRR